MKTQEMAKSIIYTGGDVAFGNIYKYTVAYDPTNANLNFGLKSNGSSLNDFAPSVAVKPIAQSGAQSVQMDSYTEAFKNMDMFMLMPENERLAHKYRNKYAALTDDLVYDPTMSTYQNNTAWFRPYTTFEKVDLKNGPKVSNITYGTLAGFDTEIQQIKNISNKDDEYNSIKVICKFNILKITIFHLTTAKLYFFKTTINKYCT